MQKPIRPGAIFINYRRDDCLDEARTIREKLQNTLGASQVVFLDGHSITLTEDWKTRIKEALKQAEVMISLIGPKWKESFEKKAADDPGDEIGDWVRFEIETALAERIDILPVFLRQAQGAESHKLPDYFPAEVAPVLGKQGFFVKTGGLEPMAADLADSLKALFDTHYASEHGKRQYPKLDPLAALPLPNEYADMLHAWDDEKNKPAIDKPFLGPTYFSENEAALYFGRERDIRRLYHLIRRTRLTLLHGYSGSGKSSLLHAGLLPRMQPLTGWIVCSPIRRNKQAGGLHRQLETWKESHTVSGDKRMLLTIDQVEEMYNDPLPGQEANEEVETLGRSLRELLEAHPNLYITLAFRSEFLSKISQEFIPKFGLSRFFGDAYLRPLTQEGIVEAITGPMKYDNKFKYSIEQVVAQEIAKDFVGDDFSPHAILLQIQLVELWDAAGPEGAPPVGFVRQITSALYQDNRRKELGPFIDERLEELKDIHPKWTPPFEKGLGLDILYGFTTEMGTATSKTRAGFVEQYNHIEGVDPDELLNAFQLVYLLNTAAGHQDTLRLAHDTLAPIIRKKYNASNAPAQRARRIVETKEREIGFLASFSETDVETILTGRQGMSKIPDEVWKRLQLDQERYDRQRRERFDLAFNTAYVQVQNLQYAEALDKLWIASRERIHPEDVLGLASHLPFFFLETGQMTLLKESLTFIEQQNGKEDPPLSALIRMAEQPSIRKSDMKNPLEQWDPGLFRRMNQRHFPELVAVPGGTYAMGSEEGYANEKPPHEVTISPFQMASTPVTFWQYGLFCLINGRDMPGDSGFGRGDRPVINLTWFEAIEYCNWLSEWLSPLDGEILEKVYTINGDEVLADWTKNGFRLPTEAEWEYAAREGGKPVRFGNGKEVANPGEMNFDASHPYNDQQPKWYVKGRGRGATTSVREFQPNALGLYDMSGNVYDWCWDWWSEGADSFYRKSDGSQNPTGPESGNYRVVRGGSWYDTADECRCSYRFRILPMDRDDNVGFRVVRRPNHP